MLILLAVANLAVASSHATLLGDTVLARHHLKYTANGTVVNFAGDHYIDVTDDASDASSIGRYYSLDMNSFGFGVAFLDDTTWAPILFNGLVITDMDWLGLGPAGILGVSISTNLAGWNDSRFAYDDHSASANWSGLAFNLDSFFNVTFSVDLPVDEPPPSSSPVPDSGATAAMLGLGMFGLAAVKRRAKR